MSGIFVSFEGIDGAGKSTHIDRLAQAFKAQGRQVTLSREPGGTPLAEEIRQWVLNQPMDPMTEALLVFAARRDHVQQVIAPALARNGVVLCDRFTDATFAYQGAGRGFDWQILGQLERWVQTLSQPDHTSIPTPLVQPDITIWFDLPPSVAAQRLAGARVPDKFEAQPQQFFEAVASGYARRLAQDPRRFARVNADQAPEAVWAEVKSQVQARGFLT